MTSRVNTVPRLNDFLRFLWVLPLLAFIAAGVVLAVGYIGMGILESLFRSGQASTNEFVRAGTYFIGFVGSVGVLYVIASGLWVAISLAWDRMTGQYRKPVDSRFSVVENGLRAGTLQNNGGANAIMKNAKLRMLGSPMYKVPGYRLRGPSFDALAWGRSMVGRKVSTDVTEKQAFIPVDDIIGFYAEQFVFLVSDEGAELVRVNATAKGRIDVERGWGGQPSIRMKKGDFVRMP